MTNKERLPHYKTYRWSENKNPQRQRPHPPKGQTHHCPESKPIHLNPIQENRTPCPLSLFDILHGILFLPHIHNKTKYRNSFYKSGILSPFCCFLIVCHLLKKQALALDHHTHEYDPLTPEHHQFLYILQDRFLVAQSRLRISRPWNIYLALHFVYLQAGSLPAINTSIHCLPTNAGYPFQPESVQPMKTHQQRTCLTALQQNRQKGPTRFVFEESSLGTPKGEGREKTQ